ncbi:hypothetical protein HanXRQr2_Chr14g0664751 [Helianthus annuus]|uniref:Uncharacterized protein n=1 Tax=Helianthus annuus TaxID=4232 RepID=A0A9K3ED26_HELAN|nr:hypothetical protein HanXRQr2_Chr14g0664751 [Helianthus annuus]
MRYYSNLNKLNFVHTIPNSFPPSNFNRWQSLNGFGLMFPMWLKLILSPERMCRQDSVQ